MSEIGTLLLILFVLCIAVASVRFLKEAVDNWRKKRHLHLIRVLDNELQNLLLEIDSVSSVKLTTEIIPNRFISKEAAQAFGEKWCAGETSCFKALAIDHANNDENHPNFDRNSISGGILYSYPAQFFGLAEANDGSDKWLEKFCVARNDWLKRYRASFDK